MKQKWKRYSASLLALLLCVTLFASTAFAAGGALGADRNGTPYTLSLIHILLLVLPQPMTTE